MPHIIVECSANVPQAIDLDALLGRLHAAALETGVFPIGGLRTRAAVRDHYRIADGDPANAFVHVVLRIGSGRDLDTRRRAAEAVFTALCDELHAFYARAPLAISLELQEIVPETSFRQNNLHDYVKERATQPC
jgi:5-carboxymethyl-2-hydroxymuconate isomerase